jgi:hypothetical protein
MSVPAVIRRSARARRAWMCLAMLLTGLARADEWPGEAPHGADSELRTKAAYLYQFGAYVVWPEGAFATADAPVVVGLLDAGALADELALFVGGRSVQGRTIVIRKLQPEDPVAGVHMLFVGQGANGRVAAALSAARSLPVLTVSDAPSPAQGAGAMIRFVSVDGRLRFDVSPKAAELSHLGISARLLAVARRVDPGAP